MLICNVSLRPPARVLAVTLAEAAAAADTASMLVGLLAPIDEPVTALETLDAFVGQIMLEAASASDSVQSGLIYAVLLDEPASAADAAGVLTAGGISAEVAEAATADVVVDGAVQVTPASYDGLATNVALSNGNRTVLHNVTNTNSGAISTAFESTGQYYFEVKLENATTTGHFLGVMISTWGSVFSSTQMTTNSTSVQIGGTAGIYSNGGNTGKTLGASAVNDVYSCAIDLTNDLAWFRKNGGNWNGDASADPATGTGGVAMAAGSFAPIVRFGATGGTTDQMTGNFGQAAFVYTAPSGFGTWPA